MLIGGYLKTSLIEWPEKISSVIFTAGCNFRCPFCHNGELVEIRRYEDTTIRRYEEKEILADLEKRKEWNDAVIVTGGEPTIHKDLPEFLKKIKDFGYLTMLHTNGTNPKMIDLLFKKKLIDRISIDIKGDFENYENFIGEIGPASPATCVDAGAKRGEGRWVIGKIRESLEIIINSGLDYELRTTVVPGLHNQENLLLLANQLKEILNTCFDREARRAKYLILNTKWYLQQFRPLNTFDKEYLKIKPFSLEEMNEIKETIEVQGLNIVLRGV